MYIPQSFAEVDRDKLHDFIEKHSFATLVSLDGGEPFASHLPLLLNRNAGEFGMLRGHMARANPQWRHAENRNVLAIFSGPHTYISPTWYGATNVVPTWNYVAVHVYGILRLVTDEHRVQQIVRQSVEFYERSLPVPWSTDDTEPGFVDGLLGGIVGFEIAIDRIEGKWKLNQNHDSARRKNVIRALRKAGGEDQSRIADLMAETLSKSTPS